ncbi:1D-myo-inositol 2-acetamido-2-deoxy-alpha-D-glucopyranoside deacetylase [Micromonospora humidisoli]|uniref:1D-myo-inositol 2-acetamido-2-deoxy-alpha-D-glucopyranoside deacetylase n=1 Tax=Micromonospora humidisoli TaxID=2807622 RepID=A0ABS2J7X8_9ACTN|nr:MULTISPECIES: N-acetyl-1-D-myo-inositol-2-amino-2-deoxy-alpha-D-glucopyranoside deacetylase [Micromonospora]MBM7082603.1 N-acetyl-1-D-myo-inositol-2-amino-2-deoxy-alpha-D-glucopyranoside deacetylase [Micromonospora humidisoli]GHJ05828.1 1D-myo-inositol 2-acetamido-2-deoxy-alpha-D-glucopyranoside deacetylase [Micromonospora sp. AKA109]
MTVVTTLPDRRLLLVHAHPDDESIGTGSTMAHYAAAGAHVTLVTCTLGEEGEVHVPALAQLVAAEADQLGGFRIGELGAACAALGVTDHRFLGGAGRYRDSGMMGMPTNEHPRAFWRADLDEAAGLLLEVIREIRPQVLVTYDPNGFYGHPDHIQAHRVAMRAHELAGAEGIAPAKVYWTALPRSVLEAGMSQFTESSDNPFAAIDGVDDLPFGTPDEQIAARIDATDQHAAKEAAMRAHATQIPADSWLYAIAGNFGAEFMGVEYFTLAVGEPGPAGGPNGWENDLFAGIDPDPVDLPDGRPVAAARRPEQATPAGDASAATASAGLR